MADLRCRGGRADYGGASFVLPLQWGAINLGVLDLYRAAPGMLDSLQLRDLLAAADTRP